MTKTTADSIVEILKESGIQRVYGLPGDSLNGLTDAIRRTPSIAWEHVRHEESAAFAAAAEVVPGDVLLSAAPELATIPSIRSLSSHTQPDGDALIKAAQRINEAKKITILGGAGCKDAASEVMQLAEALKAPIVHTLRGKEYLEPNNPYDVGMTGLLGFSSGYHAMEQSDLLIILGADFPYQQFYPHHGNVIQVDIRGENLGRRTPIAQGLVGSVRDTIPLLLPHITADRSDDHLATMRRHYTKARQHLDSLAHTHHNRAPIHPEYVVRTISKLANDNAIFIPDVGSPIIWAARYLDVSGDRRLIGSFNHGTMANAVPHAIGAQASQPHRQVITLSGDGGVAMLLGDLITLVQRKLPVKVVVFNNSSLSFVELEMKASGFVTFGTDLENPRFADVATSLGMVGKRVEKPDELESAIKEAFAHDGPALIEVVTARQELAMPPHITLEQMKGFSLYGLRTVISGHGDELIDIAKENIFDRLLP